MTKNNKTNKVQINNKSKSKVKSKTKKLKSIVKKSLVSRVKTGSGSRYKKNKLSQKNIISMVGKKADNYRLGYITKKIKGSRYIVRLNNKGNKIFYLARPIDIACAKQLKDNLHKYVGMWKSGKTGIKNYKQAVSLAYKDTREEYPKCLIVEQDNNIN